MTPGICTEHHRYTQLLIASTTREIILCMKRFYNLKLKTKQDRDLMGKVAFIHINEDNKYFKKFFFLNCFFLPSEKLELL